MQPNSEEIEIHLMTMHNHKSTHLSFLLAIRVSQPVSCPHLFLALSTGGASICGLVGRVSSGRQQPQALTLRMWASLSTNGPPSISPQGSKRFPIFRAHISCSEHGTHPSASGNGVHVKPATMMPSRYAAS